MKKIAVISAIVAASVMGVAPKLQAQDNSPQSSMHEAGTKAKKHRALPFHGLAAMVNTNAMTLTVGHLVLHVTPKTKITKQGKPATLSDIMVGQRVSGSYKKDDSGRLHAKVIHIKAKGWSREHKKKAESAAGN